MQAGGSDTVHLTPVMNGSQFDKWEMSLNGGKPGGPGHYPPVNVAMGASNGTITFHIEGNPNNGIFCSLFDSAAATFASKRPDLYPGRHDQANKRNCSRLRRFSIAG